MGNGDNRIGFILSSLNFALFLSSSYTRPSTYTFIADLMTRFDNEGNRRLTTIIAAVQKHAVRFSLEKWMFDNKGERESLDGDKTRIRIPNSQHQFPSKPRGNFAPVICISPDFLPYHFLWMIRIGQATREQSGKFDMWIFFSNFRTRRNSFTPYPLPFSPSGQNVPFSWYSAIRIFKISIYSFGIELFHATRRFRNWSCIGTGGDRYDF